MIQCGFESTKVRADFVICGALDVSAPSQGTAVVAHTGSRRRSLELDGARPRFVVCLRHNDC